VFVISSANTWKNASPYSRKGNAEFAKVFWCFCRIGNLISGLLSENSESDAQLVLDSVLVKPISVSERGFIVQRGFVLSSFSHRHHRSEFAPVALVALITALSAPVGGCKRTTAPSQSETKSLDNFAGGEFVVNSCMGREAVVAPQSSLHADPASIKTLNEVLGAVPTELQTAFFDGLRGEIRVVADHRAACRTKSTGSSAAREDLVSCWQPSEDGKSVTIFIRKGESNDETSRNIRHATVRAFGYVLSQIIVKIRQTAQGSELGENAAFDEVKSEIAQSFILDVAGSKDFKLENLTAMLDQSVVAEGLSEGERTAAWKAMPAGSRKTEFMDAVFAEAFDSWQCSSSTRGKMAASFSRTAAAFAPVMDELRLALGPNPPAASSDGDGANVPAMGAASDSKSGLGLWGRWGSGNGPIRQGLSNWGSFRREGGGLFNARRWGEGGGFVFRRPFFAPWRWGR